MARRATPAEIIAAERVMFRRDAEVTAEALAAVERECTRMRDADYEEFDWREYAGTND